MRAKQLIDEGRLGRVLQFRAAYLHAGSADPAAPLRWKLTAAAGGGVIADLASHVLDLVEHLAGPIDAVLAETHAAYAQRPSAEDPTRNVPIDAEDCVLILARLQSGAPGTIEATKIASGAEDELRLEIHGSQGALRLNLMDPHHLEFYDAMRRRSAAGRPAGLEPHRHRPALLVARHRISQPQSGHRLDPRARGLPGQFPSGRCPGRAAEPGLAAGHPRAAVDGVREAIGHRATVGQRGSFVEGWDQLAPRACPTLQPAARCTTPCGKL